MSPQSPNRPHPEPPQRQQGSIVAPDFHATDLGVTEKQRKDLDAWKASQLAKAPAMDEATARRVSAALWPVEAPAGRRAGTPKAKGHAKGGEAA